MSVDIEVRDVPGNHRYEALAGEVVAGFIEYADHDGQRTLQHTEVSDDFAGQGIGGTLVRAALEDLRSRGRKVRPVCPFVASWINRHPEYGDLAAG